MQAHTSVAITRRSLLLAMSLALRPARGAAPAISVVYKSGPEVFDDALEGLQRVLSRSGAHCELVDLRRHSQLVKSSYRLVVAMGGEALESLKAQRSDAAAVASMALRDDINRYAAALRIDGRVVLDVPAGDFLAELTSLLPGKPRLGLIRNPERPGGLDTGLQAKAKQGAVALRVVACTRPDDLLPAFLSLREHVDLVVAVPDGTLYNGATAKPLIMASLENRLPVVGFSASFVRAGAAIGIYPDFREIGAQTGDLTVRLLGGGPGGEEEPRRLAVGVNHKVVRLLGLDVRRPHAAEMVVFK